MKDHLRIACALTGLFAMAWGVAVSPVVACSMFAVAFDGHAYMANNEDYVEPGYVWFVPGGKKSHGRVNFGFADRFVQGGMNDMGLAFDAAVVAEVPYERDRKKKTPENLVDKIMDECATVDEAVAYFEKYNCPHLSRTQFMFADKGGASSAVAWLPDRGLSVVRKSGPYQLITNSRLEASSYRCERFVLAERMLRESSGYSLDRIRDTLDAMHQRGEQAFTSYSNVYNLRLGTVTVYNLADFGRSVTYNLAKELTIGGHSYSLASAFENSKSLNEIRSAAPRQYDTAVVLPESELRRFTGKYRIQGKTVEVSIELREGSLVLVPPDNVVAHLFPEDPTLFRIREGGQIRFDTSVTGPASGFTIYRFGDHHAERID